VVGIIPNNGSPVKRISTSQLPYSKSPLTPGHRADLMSMSMNSPGGGEVPESPLHKCYSTEELSQEISNLEGLMKDLNAITASEFQC